MAANWTTVTFGEVVRLEQGLCFNKKTNHLMAATGIPLLRIADLINRTETKFVDAENVPKKFIAAPQDIIFSRTGQVGLVFKGRVGVVHNNCFRVIPGAGIDRNYVYWYLRQPSIVERARSLAGGAAQPDLGHDAFKSIAFTYPALEAQRRIAGILSAYDDLIENCERRIRVLDEMARALYREWFVLFRYPGHEKTPLVDSELGRIPKGWRCDALKTVVRVNVRQVDPKRPPARIRYIDISSVSPGTVESVTEYDFADAPGRARRIVGHGDVLWSCVRPNRRSYALVLHPDQGTIASTGFAVLTADRVPYAYVYAATTTDDFVAYLEKRATGAAYPAVTAKVFEDAPLLIPDEPVLDRFAEAATPYAETIASLRRRIDNLRRTRDLLLPRLLSGELGVEDAA